MLRNIKLVVGSAFLALMLLEGSAYGARDFVHQEESGSTNDAVTDRMLREAKVGNLRLQRLRNFEAQGANFRARNRRGQTLLHFDMYPDAMDYVLIRGMVDVNTQDNEGNTPLHVVGGIERAIAFLRAGADPLARNNLGQTPVEYEEQFPGEEEGLVAFLRGAENAFRQDTLDIFLQDAENALYGNTLDDFLREFFLEGSAYGSAYGERGFVPQEPRSISNAVTDAMLEDAERGDFELRMLRNFEARGADLGTRNWHGRTLLHFDMYPDAMDYVLIRGMVDVNTQDNEGNTPLHVAGGIEVAIAFLRAGANPFARNNLDQTPVEYREQFLGEEEDFVAFLRGAENAFRQDTLDIFLQGAENAFYHNTLNDFLREFLQEM